MKQYNSVFKHWWKFCEERQVDPLTITKNLMLDFLTVKFNEGASYGTINTIRSALSELSGSDLGKNPLICRFMTGVYKLRPTFPRYQERWDVGQVLSTLESWFPLSDLSLQDLTLKTIILVALTSAHRAQTFASIKLSDIHGSDSGVKITITEIIKTSAPGKKQPLVFSELPRES